MRRNQTTRASPPMSIAIVDVILVELKLPVLQHLIRFWLLNLMMIHEENFFQKGKIFLPAIDLWTGAEKIRTRLQELENSRKAEEKDAKALRLSEMNRKNRLKRLQLEMIVLVMQLVIEEAMGRELAWWPLSRLWKLRLMLGRIVGFRVPENHGRSHQLILTFRNYKRRRGIF
ncbi:unnamed protein product [Vicia faba]|uniref:Uncharacterized protein n=1 Tax=Vicia faba TaxID=3906 RepID=A0AAV1AAC6_VICFA|nr:unnamed protein product [Vicia faba]